MGLNTSVNLRGVGISDGVEVRPALEFDVQSDNFNLNGGGIGDVRNSPRFSGEVTLQQRTAERNGTELFRVITDLHNELSNVISGKLGTMLLDSVPYGLQRLLAQQGFGITGQFQAKLTVKVGLAASAEVCLGWEDMDGYQRVCGGGEFLNGGKFIWGIKPGAMKIIVGAMATGAGFELQVVVALQQRTAAARSSTDEDADEPLFPRPELPTLASQLLQAPFLTHCLGCKLPLQLRQGLPVDLTYPGTRDGMPQAVEAFRQQLSIDRKEERGPPVASDKQQTGAAGHGSSSPSDTRSGRREERISPPTGGNQRLCEDDVGLRELLLQERNSGRPLWQAEADNFPTTRQLLQEQLEREEPFYLPPDGGCSRDELDEAKRDLLPYSLKEAQTSDHRRKIQVVVDVGRPIFGDEQRRILRGMNVVFSARIGRRKHGGEWARRKPELYLCPWKTRDKEAGSDSTLSTHSKFEHVQQPNAIGS